MRKFSKNAFDWFFSSISSGFVCVRLERNKISDHFVVDSINCFVWNSVEGHQLELSKIVLKQCSGPKLGLAAMMELRWLLFQRQKQKVIEIINLG